MRFNIDGFALESGLVDVYRFNDKNEFVGIEQCYVTSGCSVPFQTTIKPPPVHEEGFKYLWLEKSRRWIKKPV